MGDWLMYKIVLKKKAKKFIDKLPLNEKKRIVAAIEKLPETGDRYTKDYNQCWIMDEWI